MENKKAVAYLRTSSQSNVGEDKDSHKRQMEAINKYANENAIEIVREFYDASVRGGDAVVDRPEFSNMLSFIAETGAKIVLVETVNRFARDLIVQLTGHAFLKKNGITLIPVDVPDYFVNETPSAILIRQVLGAVSEFEKTALVDKLKKARDRKRKETGRCEGRKPVPDEAIIMARELRASGHTLLDIGQILSSRGFRVRRKDKPTGMIVTTDVVFKPQSIKAMLEKYL